MLMLQMLQEMRLASESIKQEVSKIRNAYAQEFYNFGGYIVEFHLRLNFGNFD